VAGGTGTYRGLGAQHEALEVGVLSDDKLIYHLTKRLMALVGRMRERLHALADLDPCLTRPIGEVVGKLEMQLWAVRVQTD
jgi:hypothetical protein